MIDEDFEHFFGVYPEETLELPLRVFDVYFDCQTPCAMFGSLLGCLGSDPGHVSK